MSSTIIIAMGATAVATVVTEKILILFGKADLAQMISIGGFSLIGIEAITLVGNVLSKTATLIK